MRKFQRNLKIEHKHSLVPSFHSKNKNVAISQENWTKSAIKLSVKVVLYLILWIDFNIFLGGLSEKTISTSFLGPKPSYTTIINEIQYNYKRQFHQILVSLAPFLMLNSVFRVPEMWQKALFLIFQKVLFRT